MRFLHLFPLISSGFLLVSLTGKTTFLKKRGISVTTKPENPPRFTFVIYPVFLLIALLWGFEIARNTFGFQFSLLPETIVKPLVESQVLTFSGVFILFLFLLFFLLTLLHFNESLRFGMNSNNLGKLVTTGVFSVSRNPFFVSIELFFVGTALVFFTPFFIGFALAAFVGIHFFILKEEKFLEQNYGEAYKKYSEKVRRYF